MVAITRAAAVRQQQTSNADATAALNVVGKKSGKKKKKIVDEYASSSLSSNTCLVNTTTTGPTSLPKVKLCHDQNNNDVIDSNHAIGINSLNGNDNDNDISIDDLNGGYNAIGVNNNNQCVNLPSIQFNQIDNNQEDKLSDFGDDNEPDTIISWSIIPGEIQWCKTNRGNGRMCMNGYTYDFMSQSLKKNIRYFRCTKKDGGCRAVVYVLIDSNMYKASNNIEHNHPPNHHNVKRLLVLQKIKERVLVEPTSITRIIEDEYVKNDLNDGDRQMFLLPATQASKFYKIRAKMLPPNPKSLDFEVPKLYSKTNSGEDFLIYDATRKKLGGRLMIFSTQVLIKMLCGCETIFIDGTFKTRPTLFSQVYVIMGKHLDEAIPLVWCLMSKRTQDVYEKIFKVLKRKAIEYGLKLQPQYAYLDFEISTIKALEKIFPGTSIHGCWYHYVQSLFRNVQKIGLTTMYEKNEEVKRWLKSFMALPLIKSSAVDDAITLLIENLPSSNGLLKEFCDYFQNQWISRVPIKYWHLGPRHLRCNNNVEGYNNRLQHRFGVHPKLWSFIHFLKAEESLVMMRASQIRSGNYRYKAMPFSISNEKLRKKTKQLKNLSRLFELGSINLKKYITNLSFFVGESATKQKKKNNDIHNILTTTDNNDLNNINI